MSAPAATERDLPRLQRMQGLVARLRHIEDGEHWERAVESALSGILQLIEEGQPATAADLVEVVIDGASYRVPAALREGYMLKADYSRKTMHLAERRRALEAEALRLGLGPLKDIPPAPGNIFAQAAEPAVYNALKEGH